MSNIFHVNCRTDKYEWWDLHDTFETYEEAEKHIKEKLNEQEYNNVEFSIEKTYTSNRKKFLVKNDGLCWGGY